MGSIPAKVRAASIPEIYLSLLALLVRCLQFPLRIVIW